MDRPELVAVPCPTCGRLPVEVLKKLRTGGWYLWCPQCRAIWVVDHSIWTPSDRAYQQRSPA